METGMNLSGYTAGSRTETQLEATLPFIANNQDLQQASQPWLCEFLELDFFHLCCQDRCSLLSPFILSLPILLSYCQAQRGLDKSDGPRMGWYDLSMVREG